LNEVELIQITDEIFRELGLKIVIKINNRKILSGVAETIGEAERMMDITMAIDKLEKIGLDEVNKELTDRGLSNSAIEKLQPILFLEGNPNQKFDALRNILSGSEIGMKGVEEMGGIYGYLDSISISSVVEFDLTLARGLNYYTGAIIEVLSADVEMGSVAGGGRYDDLTGIFGLPSVSGVGISFGADRIYDVLSQTGGFPEDFESTIALMFVNFGENEEKHCLKLLERIRKSGIMAELFPDRAKIKKQLAYAHAKKIPYVALVGEIEIKEDLITLKEMKSGEQSQKSLNELIDELSSSS